MKTKRRGSTPHSLSRLVAEALQRFERLRYHPTSVGSYRRTWQEFRRFVTKAGYANQYRDRLAEQFLESLGIPLIGPNIGKPADAVRRAMRALSEFARDGCVLLRRRIVERVRLAPQLAAALAKYSKHCVQRHRISPRTMRRRTRTLTLFLYLLESRGTTSPGAATPADISAFVRSRCHLHQHTVYSDLSELRSFLRIGFVLGFMPADLSSEIPRMRYRQHEHIPSVWKAEDVEAMLRAVDRSSPVGKRDYAILLLACRLGMRAGDIRTLKLEDIQWRRSCLCHKQAKTGIPLELPFGDEVANALIDYLRNGRPPNDYREVFVRAGAPFIPFSSNTNLHYVVDKHRRLAGVQLPLRCRRGLHSLRHTLASRLLAVGVSIESIGGVLGHTSSNATNIYTSVDVDALRTAALDVLEGPDDA